MSNKSFSNYKHFANFDIMHSCFLKHTFARHSHDEYVISLNLTGLEDLWHEGKQYEIPAGWLTIYNPGEIHGSFCKIDQPWEIKSLYPRVDWVRQIAHECDLRITDYPIFNSPVVTNKNIVDQFLHCYNLLDNQMVESLQSQEFIVLFLMRLLFLYSDKGHRVKPIEKKNKSINQAIAYLSDYSTQSVSLQNLSQVSGLSQFHLVRTFKEATGLTPHQYQLNCRIQLAKRLLKNTSSLAEISLKLGYVDQSHFGRIFKSFTGLTPFQYQKSIGSAE